VNMLCMCVSQDVNGDVVDSWQLVSASEERLLLHQFLRFEETRAIAQHLILQQALHLLSMQLRPPFSVDSHQSTLAFLTAALQLSSHTSQHSGSSQLHSSCRLTPFNTLVPRSCTPATVSHHSTLGFLTAALQLPSHTTQHSGSSQLHSS